MAFKMKGNPLKMGSMATKSTMEMGHKSSMKKGHTDPAAKGEKKEYQSKTFGAGAEGYKRPTADLSVEKKQYLEPLVNKLEKRELKKMPSKKSAMKLDKKKGQVKKGSYTTHGNPSKYTTASGKSVSSANIDEGNLSTVKQAGGRKFVVVQDATERFKAGTKLYIGDSSMKMKKGFKPSNVKDSDKVTGTKTSKTGKKSVKRKADTKPGGLKMKKGSAMKLSEEDKKKAMDNAMPAAKKVSMSKNTMDSAKKRKLMTASGAFDMDKAKTELRRLKSASSPTEANYAGQEEIGRLIKAFS